MNDEPFLRVGRIPYANLHPIFAALEAHFPLDGIRFVEGDPRDLNRMLREGELDLSPSSSIEYALHPERYLLCPDLSVAARNKVMSVLLLSNVPVADLPDDAPVGITGASDTSVVLLEILLREFLGKRNPLVRTSLPEEEALARFPAHLTIGDRAIRASLAGTARHVTDLGEWWRKETGRPFVFALWIVSRSSAERRGDAIRKFARMLLDAKRLAREAIEGPDGDAVGPAWIPAGYRRTYWSNLSWDLGEETEGLTLYYRLARRIGRIPAVPPLRFLPE